MLLGQQMPISHPQQHQIILKVVKFLPNRFGFRVLLPNLLNTSQLNCGVSIYAHDILVQYSLLLQQITLHYGLVVALFIIREMCK
ncbi:hypothetical protein D3C77_547760 [compost metagenome]